MGTGKGKGEERELIIGVGEGSFSVSAHRPSHGKGQRILFIADPGATYKQIGGVL